MENKLLAKTGSLKTPLKEPKAPKDKNSAEVRFPGSSMLFKFCLGVVNHRSDKKSSSIHDQEIGNILQYNPSDTSHWKRGKKAVKSIYALEALGNALLVDVDLLQLVASGSIDFDEAWVEFLETEEIRALQQQLTPQKILERVARNKSLELVATKILSDAQISTVPVFLPEIFSHLDFITLQPTEIVERLARGTKNKPNNYTIRYRKGDIRAHTRMAIAKELAKIIILSEREKFPNLPEKNDDFLLGDVSCLAAAILMPQNMFKSNVTKQILKSSLVRTLVETFWAPQCFVRARLASLALQKADDVVLLSEPLFLKPQAQAKPRVVVDFSEDEAKAS
jgi:hypothetical protein